MKKYLADLHIHTALSPCASPEMTPPVIVRAALARGLAMIAICDHNTAGNALAAQQAAGAIADYEARVAELELKDRRGPASGADRTAKAESGNGSRTAAIRRGETGPLIVLAGIEITTVEEVHVLGLFPDGPSAMAVDEEVRGTLPEQSVTSDNFGLQILLDAQGQITGRERKMLAAASRFTLEQTVRLVQRHGGLAIASHADRPAFSVMSQLGFFPTAAGFDAIELSIRPGRKPVPGYAPARPSVPAAAPEELASTGLPLIASSDSHYPADIGVRCTRLHLREPSFAELALAFRGAEGRRASVA